RGRILEQDRLAAPREAEAAQGGALARARPDRAPGEGGLDDAVRHAPRSSARVLPRSAATASGVFSNRSAAIVARTMLCGLFEPRHLVSTFAMPASSTTARTPPPAITPVPSDAGVNSTAPAAKLAIASDGVVPSGMGTARRLVLAASLRLRNATGPSLAALTSAVFLSCVRSSGVSVETESSVLPALSAITCT